MADTLEVLRLEIAKLEIKPGDALVIRLDMDGSLGQAKAMESWGAALRAELGCVVLFVPHGTELCVVKRECVEGLVS
jgi:hypothetical protein